MDLDDARKDVWGHAAVDLVGKLHRHRRAVAAGQQVVATSSHLTRGQGQVFKWILWIRRVGGIKLAGKGEGRLARDLSAAARAL